MSNDDKSQPNDVPLVGAEDIIDPNTGNRQPIQGDWTKTVERGDILQISPDAPENEMIAGCFLVVEDIKPWGVQGYIPEVGKTLQDHSGIVYFRIDWANVEPTGGKVVWQAGNESDG